MKKLLVKDARKDAEKALDNAIRFGEEFDIPEKYSNDKYFTKILETLLRNQDHKFESFMDSRYGIIHSYTIEGLDETDTWTVWLIMDKSLYHEGVCIGILGQI